MEFEISRYRTETIRTGTKGVVGNDNPSGPNLHRLSQVYLPARSDRKPRDKLREVRELLWQPTLGTTLDRVRTTTTAAG